MQGGELAFLAFQFLQQIGFQVGTTGDFHDFENHTECGMMVGSAGFFGKIRHLGVEILQTQQGADTLVEGKVVANHGAVKWVDARLILNNILQYIVNCHTSSIASCGKSNITLVQMRHLHL